MYRVIQQGSGSMNRSTFVKRMVGCCMFVSPCLIGIIVNKGKEMLKVIFKKWDEAYIYTIYIHKT